MLRTCNDHEAISLTGNERLRVTVKHINAETTIRIDGVGPVSNELAPDNEARVWSYGGKAYFSLPAPTEVSIYTVSGTLYDRRTLPAGDTSIALPAGFYIIRTDNKTIKIENTN